MELLYKLIIYISDNFKDNYYFFIIDQYKEKIDKNNNVIEKIKNFLSYIRFFLVLDYNIKKVDSSNTIKNKILSKYLQIN